LFLRQVYVKRVVLLFRGAPFGSEFVPVVFFLREELDSASSERAGDLVRL
jgi:hypothetical protein